MFFIVFILTYIESISPQCRLECTHKILFGKNKSVTKDQVIELIKKVKKLIFSHSEAQSNAILLGLPPLFQSYQESVNKYYDRWGEEERKSKLGQVVKEKIDELTPLIEMMYMMSPLPQNEYEGQQKITLFQLWREPTFVRKVLYQKYLCGLDIEKELEGESTLVHYQENDPSRTLLCQVERGIELRSHIYEEFQKELERVVQEFQISTQEWIQVYTNNKGLACEVIFECQEIIQRKEDLPFENFVNCLLIASRVNPHLKEKIVQYYPHLSTEIEWSGRDLFLRREGKKTVLEYQSKKRVTRTEFLILEDFLEQGQHTNVSFIALYLLGENSINWEETSELFQKEVFQWIWQTNRWIERFIFSFDRWNLEGKKEFEQKIEELFDLEEKISHLKYVKKGDESVHMQMVQQIEKWRQIFNRLLIYQRNKDLEEKAIRNIQNSQLQAKRNWVNMWSIEEEFLREIEKKHQMNLKKIQEERERLEQEIAEENQEQLSWSQIMNYLELNQEKLGVLVQNVNKIETEESSEVHCFLRFYRDLKSLHQGQLKINHENIDSILQRQVYLENWFEVLYGRCGGGEKFEKVNRKIRSIQEVSVEKEKILEMIGELYSLKGEQIRYFILYHHRVSVCLKKKKRDRLLNLWLEEEFVTRCYRPSHEEGVTLSGFRSKSQSYLDYMNQDIRSEDIEEVENLLGGTSYEKSFMMLIYRLIKNYKKVSIYNLPQDNQKMRWTREDNDVLIDFWEEMERMKEDLKSYSLENKNFFSQSAFKNLKVELKECLKKWLSILTLEKNYDSKGECWIGMTRKGLEQEMYCVIEIPLQSWESSQYRGTPSIAKINRVVQTDTVEGEPKEEVEKDGFFLKMAIYQQNDTNVKSA